MAREEGVDRARELFVRAFLQQVGSSFHDTAECSFGLDVRAVKLGIRPFVEGFANRLKDPLIRALDRFHKALVRLAVDIEGAGLAVVIGPPPVGSVERRRRFSALGPFDGGMAVTPSLEGCGKQNIDLMFRDATALSLSALKPEARVYWISGISAILPLSR